MDSLESNSSEGLLLADALLSDLSLLSCRTIGTSHIEDLSSIPEGELIAVQLGHTLMTADCSAASRGKAGLIDILSVSLKKNQL